MNTTTQGNEIFSADIPEENDWYNTDIGKIVMGTNTRHTDPEYTEDWPRILYYCLPKEYDFYGYNENMQKWPFENFVFSIMDDFGNAVPHDAFNYSEEELRCYLAPDYDPATPIGQPYKYIRYDPMPH